MNRLEGVKPGDKLKVKRDYESSFDVYIVKRVTKTQAACGDRSFKIDSGLQIGTGDGYRSRHASFCSDEQYLRALQDARIREAQINLKRLQVTDANVAAVEALLAPKTQQEGA